MRKIYTLFALVGLMSWIGSADAMLSSAGRYLGRSMGQAPFMRQLSTTTPQFQIVGRSTFDPLSYREKPLIERRQELEKEIGDLEQQREQVNKDRDRIREVQEKRSDELNDLWEQKSKLRKLPKKLGLYPWRAYEWGEYDKRKADERLRKMIDAKYDRLDKQTDELVYGDESERLRRERDALSDKWWMLFSKAYGSPRYQELMSVKSDLSDIEFERWRRDFREKNRKERQDVRQKWLQEDGNYGEFEKVPTYWESTSQARSRARKALGLGGALWMYRKYKQVEEDYKKKLKEGIE